MIVSKKKQWSSHLCNCKKDKALTLFVCYPAFSVQLLDFILYLMLLFQQKSLDQSIEVQIGLWILTIFLPFIVNTPVYYMIYTTFSYIPNGQPCFRCCFYCFCQCIAFPLNREKLRQHFGIKGNMCVDVLLWFCGCHICAMMQEHIHVKSFVKKQIRPYYNWRYMQSVNVQQQQQMIQSVVFYDQQLPQQQKQLMPAQSQKPQQKEKVKNHKKLQHQN